VISSYDFRAIIWYLNPKKGSRIFFFFFSIWMWMSLYIIEGKLNTYRFFNIYYVEDWYANIIREIYAKIIGERSLADCFFSFLRLLFCIYTIIHNNNNNNFVPLFFFYGIKTSFDWLMFCLKSLLKTLLSLLMTSTYLLILWKENQIIQINI